MVSATSLYCLLVGWPVSVMHPSEVADGIAGGEVVVR
jgi:hypothetical protein